MSVVLLDDSIVHYEVLGRGRPVIFLHGWVGSWRYWISSMQVASTSFRAYALDFWGFGDTAHRDNQPDHYQIEKQTELINLFLNEMGIGKVALIGHGWGGLVALKFAAQNPKFVDRVMVTNCPIDSQSINKRLYTDTPEDLVVWLSNGNPDVQGALADAQKTAPLAIKKSQDGVFPTEIFNNVNRKHVPCLLISGIQDPLVSPPSLDELSILSDFGHHIELADAGHFPMLENAVKFNRLLTDFLALDSGLSIRELELKEEWRRRVR